MKMPQQKGLISVLNAHIVDYPTPLHLNYNWSYGSTGGLVLAMQILTGFFLTLHYAPNVDLAFGTVEHMMRNVNEGWILRYFHANGASFFFIVIYCHIFRGLYYGSYSTPRGALWVSGLIIFVLMMATAFLGYVLPWGQMSFWGATVITNLFSAVPKVGSSVVEWLWGGFCVENPTLNRFFNFHFILPFAILGMVLVHLGLLHKDGSNNPLGVNFHVERIPFYPYFYVKDLFGFLILLSVLSTFAFFWPNTLGHPDNYIPADSLSTPAHIVPEWYFLPFYAILRAIPDKLGGVLAMGGALVLLGLLPLFNTSQVRSSLFRPIYRHMFWALFFLFLFLGWLGQKPVEDPYIFMGQCATALYFFILVVGVAFVGLQENLLARISSK